MYYFQNSPSFAFPGPLLTKSACPETMPAKLQCEALESIIITPYFGVFWQSEIILSVLW
jgi:hypothetical protein